MSYKISKKDREYLASLSEAVLAKAPASSRRMIYIIVFSLFGFIAWAYFAQIDEITRGQGKIIPSGKNQIVQNLEGGIISEILVKEGDIVKRDQILVKIDNKQFISSSLESLEHLNSLNAKKLRLEAESRGEVFNPIMENYDEKMRNFLSLEVSLANSNLMRFKEQDKVFIEQINQKENEILEIKDQISKDSSSLNLVLKEVKMLSELLKSGNISQVNYLKAKKEENELSKRISSANLSIPRIRSVISEIENKRSELKNGVIVTAKKELSEVVTEISRLNQNRVTLDDRVVRTKVVSPTEGIVSKIMINTIGGVIKPGMDLIEIVPVEDTLVAEIKVKPSDVAFLREGMKAMVKITAYDFSIYGGLEGKVLQISPDTQTNEKTGESFYTVKIKTDKNYLGSKISPLMIKVGMIATADILTGKKSILDYLLKPILKAKQNALRER